MDAAPPPMSLEEVARWAYRLILGREAESQRTLEMWAGLGSPEAIAARLLEADEVLDLADLGFPNTGPWFERGEVDDAARLAARLLRGGTPLACEGTHPAAFRAAFLASPEIAPRLGGARHALGRAEFTLLGQGFSIEGQRSDAYFRGLAAAGPDPGAERLARIAACWRPGGGAGAVAVDAGANLGLTCMALAAAWPAHAEIHAFEPAPRNLRLLRRNLASNGLDRVRVHPMALGAEAGTLRFRRNPGNLATHHLMPEGSRSAAPDSEVMDVQVCPLDALHAPRLDLLKLDVEGAEALVLRGAAGTLARHRPLVVVEFNLWTLMTVAARNPMEQLEEWAAAFPFLVAFDDEGRPVPIHGQEGLLWVLHAVLTRRHGLDDLILCHELDWLDAWT